MIMYFCVLCRVVKYSRDDICVYFQIVILLESLEEEGDIILDVYFFLVWFVDAQYQYIVNYMKFSIFEVK